MSDDPALDKDLQRTARSDAAGRFSEAGDAGLGIDQAIEIELRIVADLAKYIFFFRQADEFVGHQYPRDPESPGHADLGNGGQGDGPGPGVELAAEDLGTHARLAMGSDPDAVRGRKTAHPVKVPVKRRLLDHRQGQRKIAKDGVPLLLPDPPKRKRGRSTGDPLECPIDHHVFDIFKGHRSTLPLNTSALYCGLSIGPFFGSENSSRSRRIYFIYYIIMDRSSSQFLGCGIHPGRPGKNSRTVDRVSACAGSRDRPVSCASAAGSSPAVRGRP